MITQPLGPFVALGSAFDVVAPDRDRDALWSMLEPLSAPGAVPRRTFSSEPSGGVDLLFWKITSWAVAQSPRTVVHAAAALAPQGAVLLPGPSGSGKTTLVGTLVRRGLAYLTDEAAGIEPDGRIGSFPKWLSLDPPSCRVFDVEASGDRETHLSPRALGALASEPAPVVLVVAPTYRSGASTELRALTGAEGVMLLLANAFNGDKLGADAVTAVVSALAPARCYALSYSDAVAASEVIEELLSHE